jgi:hypothetical protein
MRLTLSEHGDLLLPRDGMILIAVNLGDHVEVVDDPTFSRLRQAATT